MSYKALMGMLNREPSPELRRRVRERDEDRCQYCGAPATEIDHIVPVSRGGMTNLDNLACVCGPCNRSKGDRTPEEWSPDQVRQRLARRIAERLTRP